MPGIAASTKETFELGSAPNKVEAPENNLAFEDIDEIQTPKVISSSGHVYHQYTLRVLNGKRDQLKKYLIDNGVETKIQHPILIPQQKAYRINKNKDKLRNAKILVKKILCLPINENLKKKEMDYVISLVNNFYKK